MNYKHFIALTALLVSVNCFSQQIDIIKDLNPGFGTGFRNTSCNFSGDLYFAGVDAGPAFVEVFSLDEDLDITKKISSPTVHGAEAVFCTNNFVYIYNREAPSVRDLYRSAGGNNNAELVTSFENNIVQTFGLNDGIVIVTENNQQNKNVFYINDNSNEVTPILEGVNLGQYDFDVTSHNEYIVLSPLDDGDYDGGVTFFNTTTKQIQTDFLSGKCESVRYAYGFEDHIVYSCAGDYYVTNIVSGACSILDIDGRDALRSGVKDEAFFESDMYIFIQPQKGNGDLFAIAKNDLTETLLSEKCTSILNLIIENGQIYFTEKGNSTDTQLFQLDAKMEEDRVEITYTESDFTLIDGAVLNNDVHFIISHTGNFSEHLTSINSNDELIHFKELRYGVFNPVLEVIGDNLIFIDETNGSGVELHSLSYEGTYVNDKNIAPLKVFPNPSSGSFTIGVDQSDIVSINVIDISGRMVDYTLNGNQFSILQPGYYTVLVSTTSASYTSSLIVIE